MLLRLQAQQLEGCDDPPTNVLASTCAEACILCTDLDGYTADNDVNVVGVPPPQFCPTGYHNIRWLGFVAETTDLELEVTVFDCTGLFDDDNDGLSDGLQVGIYSTTDCVNFTEVADCVFQLEETMTATFTNNQPLIPGSVYFIVVDGFNGDVCSFTVNVTQGSAMAPEVAQVVPVINAPTETCPGGEIDISVGLVDGAGIYEWTLNGNVIATDFESTLQMPTTGGEYELCVTPRNPCSEGITACQTITVAEPEII
ncbi:MAG: hypothetical protein KDC54_20530, partial [Lewinella sp.]|nr:hypothetical protein [Lewinella sp.]